MMSKDTPNNQTIHDQAEEVGLADFRREIDMVDKQLVALLVKRMGIVNRVADYKHLHNIAPVLPKRIAHVREQAKSLGEANGLNPDYIHDLWTRIIDESCHVEQVLIDLQKQKI